MLPSFGPTFTPISVEQAIHLNTVGFAVMLLASPLFGLLADRIGRVATLRIFAVAGALGCIPAFAMLNGDPSRQAIAQVFSLLLVCAWAAGAITSFPEMLPPAVRASRIGAPYAIGAAAFGGLAPTIETALTATHGLVAAGVLMATVCATGGLATIRMRETAFEPLRTE